MSSDSLVQWVHKKDVSLERVQAMIECVKYQQKMLRELRRALEEEKRYWKEWEARDVAK